MNTEKRMCQTSLGGCGEWGSEKGFVDKVIFKLCLQKCMGRARRIWGSARTQLTGDVTGEEAGAQL